jgi:hypothetical protein
VKYCINLALVPEIGTLLEIQNIPCVVHLLYERLIGIYDVINTPFIVKSPTFTRTPPSTPTTSEPRVTPEIISISSIVFLPLTNQTQIQTSTSTSTIGTSSLVQLSDETSDDESDDSGFEIGPLFAISSDDDDDESDEGDDDDNDNQDDLSMSNQTTTTSTTTTTTTTVASLSGSREEGHNIQRQLHHEQRTLLQLQEERERLQEQVVQQVQNRIEERYLQHTNQQSRVMIYHSSRNIHINERTVAHNDDEHIHRRRRLHM